MTERQRIALTNVAAYNQIDIPFLYVKDQNGQHVTKAEAYILIQMILDGVRPSPEYLDSLGRNADTVSINLCALDARSNRRLTCLCSMRRRRTPNSG